MGRVSPWRRGIEWGLVVLILAFLAALIWPVYESVKLPAKVMLCLSNLKQVELSSLMYAYDYDERFMPRDSWMDVTDPYRKNWQLVHCPSPEIEGPDPSTIFGYAMNSNLSSKASMKIEKPAETPLHYDSINYAKNASDPVTSLPDPPRAHGKSRRNNMGFADGHANTLYLKKD